MWLYSFILRIFNNSEINYQPKTGLKNGEGYNDLRYGKIAQLKRGELVSIND